MTYLSKSIIAKLLMSFKVNNIQTANDSIASKTQSTPNSQKDSKCPEDLCKCSTYFVLILTYEENINVIRKYMPQHITVIISIYAIYICNDKLTIKLSVFISLYNSLLLLITLFLVFSE